MKRITLLLIPGLLLIVLVVVVAAEIPKETHLPLKVQLLLNQYSAYAPSPGTLSVQALEKAQTPWNLSEDRSSTVFGDSVHFQTDTGPTRTQSINLAALRYPPVKVWCILLEQEIDGEEEYAVVFAGLHTSLHNADWVIHEGPKDLSAPESMDLLTLLGCTLGLDQVGPQKPTP